MEPRGDLQRIDQASKALFHSSGQCFLKNVKNPKRPNRSNRKIPESGSWPRPTNGEVGLATVVFAESAGLERCNGHQAGQKELEPKLRTGLASNPGWALRAPFCFAAALTVSQLGHGRRQAVWEQAPTIYSWALAQLATANLVWPDITNSLETLESRICLPASPAACTPSCTRLSPRSHGAFPYMLSLSTVLHIRRCHENTLCFATFSAPRAQHPYSHSVRAAHPRQGWHATMCYVSSSVLHVGKPKSPCRVPAPGVATP